MSTASSHGLGAAAIPHDDDRLRRPSLTRSLQVGDLRVSYVADGASSIRARFLIPEATEDDWAGLGRYLDRDGCLTISAGGLLIERGERAVLIDAGFGPFTSTPVGLDHPSVARMYGGGFLDSLRQLGRSPQDVEAIAITHLHVEHVGWAGNPKPGSNAPAFTRAQVLVSDVEWRGRQAGYGVTQAALDTMAPRVRTVGGGEEVFPGVRAVALPGHTPGQLGYTITSGGSTVLAFADVMHSPIQVAHPEWATLGEDPQAGPTARRRVLEELADQDTIGYGVHFADVVFGRVHRQGTGFTWQPVP